MNMATNLGTGTGTGTGPAPISRLLSLPRELRDLIYTAFLTSSLAFPLPSPDIKWFDRREFTCWSFGNHRSIPRYGHPGRYGFKYRSQERPHTAANLLVVNRQVYAEVMECMARLRRREKGYGLPLRLNCLVEGESEIYFSWVGSPGVVRTVEGEPDEWKQLSTETQQYARHAGVWFYFEHVLFPRFWDIGVKQAMCLAHRIWPRGPPFSASRCPACSPHQITSVHQLWVDIRLHTYQSTDGNQRPIGPQTIARHVQAALVETLSHGPEFVQTGPLPDSSLVVDELILNVIPPPNFLPAVPQTAHSPSPIQTSTANLNRNSPEPPSYPLEVAQELVSAWDSIWLRDSLVPLSVLRRTPNPSPYSPNAVIFLYRIGRYRVCIDGAPFRTRELASVLKRGRTENRKSEGRGVPQSLFWTRRI